LDGKFNINMNKPSCNKGISIMPNPRLLMEVTLLKTVTEPGTWIEVSTVSKGYMNKDVGIKREYGKSPNGNDLSGAWVLRGLNKEWIDHDFFLYDLLERNNLKINPLYF
jgi:hypothetical protein